MIPFENIFDNKCWKVWEGKTEGGRTEHQLLICNPL